MKKLTDRTIVSELLEEYPGAASVLARHGMSCDGCEAAPFETLGEAAAAYGRDPEEILKDLGAVGIRAKRKPKGRKKK